MATVNKGNPYTLNDGPSIGEKLLMIGLTMAGVETTFTVGADRQDMIVEFQGYPGYRAIFTEAELINHSTNLRRYVLDRMSDVVQAMVAEAMRPEVQEFRDTDNGADAKIANALNGASNASTGSRGVLDGFTERPGKPGETK